VVNAQAGERLILEIRGNDMSGTNYQDILDKAKKTDDRPGDLVGTESFEDRSPRSKSETALDDKLSALTAMAEAVKEDTSEAKKIKESVKAEDPKGVLEVSSNKTSKVDSKSEDEAKEAEAASLYNERASKIDIGELFVNGYLCQTVEIVPKHLTVTFTTIKTVEEEGITEYLSNEPDDMSDLSYIQLAAVMFVASRIKVLKIGGVEKHMPKMYNSKGFVIANFDKRLEAIKDLPLAVFKLIHKNAVRFAGVVHKELEVSALGNG